MPLTEQTSRIDVTRDLLSGIDTDLLVVPCFEQEDLSELQVLDAASAGEVKRAFETQEFRGKLYDFFLASVVERGWKARRLALLGAGQRDQFSTDRARKIASAVGISIRRRRIRRLAFFHRGVPASADMMQAVSEGLTLATFDAGAYKTTDREFTEYGRWQIVVPGGQTREDLQTAAERGSLLGDCSNLARQLINEPANNLTPRLLAARAERLAADAGISVEILDEQAIAELKMGLILGVARGSEEPPRLIVLRYAPPGTPSTPVLGLVGKGMTFDSGGISIKPAEGMERMKDDMAGGAAVICAMRAIGLLRPPIRVIGVVPAAENMLSGKATRPGDILTAASGRTVEVVNTDAEGRLILGDGLWYARQLGATHLVDVATLTGACVVALGKVTSGVFGTPDEWVNLVRRTADQAGDRSWPLPLFEEYVEQLRSDIADTSNVGGRPAGAITAALFLKEFTGGLPWAHLDIAGTAWNDEAKPHTPKGPTGVGVRTLAELPFKMSG